MQAPLQKKDKSGIIICPRCHAENFTSQTMCGRCGLVFSKGTVKKGEKREEKADNPFAAGSHTHGGIVQPPQLPGESGRGAQASVGPAMGGEGGGNGDEEAPSEPPKPKRPDTLPEKGATEGPLREAGHASLCPMCGAGVKDGLRRCPNCGLKLGQK